MRVKSLITVFNIALIITFAAAEGYGLESYPNPHWGRNRNLCLRCHIKVPKDASEISLKFGGDYISLCNSCHEEVSKDKYIHAVAMVPPPDQLERMPEAFKKAVRKDKEGRLTCIVCHELKYQCLSTESYRKATNPRFFRGGPYAHRSDICYHCHDRSEYERLNPHDQITDEGDLSPERCLYCHDKVPDRRKVKSIKDVSFQVAENYNRLCTRCHNTEIERTEGDEEINPHGETTEHMGKPSEKVLSNIEKDDKGYIVPLEPSTGKIFCGTCHNPHEIGVQRLPKADKGADVHGRLRMGVNDKCAPCHGADFKPVAPILPAKHPTLK